jgi:hypothetical protein
MSILPVVPVGRGLLAALVDLDGRPRYLHSGWFLISVANLVVILAMIAVFALAIAIPFPRDPDES